MIELSQGDYIGSPLDRQNPALVRFDENGNVVSAWEYVVQNRFRTHFEDLIETGDDGGYLATGGNFKNPIIVKFDSTGLPHWQIAIPGKYKMNFISQTSDGGYVAAGQIPKANSAESDAWLIKLNRFGRVIWSKIVERPNSGRFLFVKEALDGGYIVAGEIAPVGSTIGPNVVIAKLDAHGRLVWNRIYSSLEPLFLHVSAMTLIAGDGVLLVGGYGSSAFLMKVNSNGEIQWTKTFSNRPHDLSLWSVVRTEDGGFVAAGSSDSFRGSDNRGLLLKIDASGKLLWARRADSELFSVDQTLDHGFSLAGMGVNFYGILKTNSRGFIPGCSLLRRFPLSGKSLPINEIIEEEVKLKSITVEAESFSITPKRLSVDGQDYCN
ncbi:hypothetical protein L0244_29995 [bacterium]|nr:hypothetical protein [bacterium]MCI0617229.1 hypothetical protein [bacterium]